MLLSQSIAVDVERACNTPEALLRLIQGLLEFEVESPYQREYLACLVRYVFYKRRKEIWRRKGRLLRDIGRMPSGCGATIDFEQARAGARAAEETLALEIGSEAVRDLKHRMGKRLSLRACVRRLVDADFKE
jgi:hypothetical protein